MNNWQPDTAIPAPVRKGLERFCSAMNDALGDELIAIILYGGLAKKDYAPTTSNVNVLVVLKHVSVKALDRIVSPMKKATRAIRLAPMVLSEDDLRSSTDVFPIKFLDMQEHHRVLWGKDVLSDLPIAKDHLRLRCEQEIKNLLLRLRKAYLQRGGKSRLIKSTLTATASAFLNSLSALLILKTGRAPTQKSAIAETAAGELGLDGNTLREVLALGRGDRKADTAELRRIYDSFMETVQKAATIVDQL
jgi:predicted nucleotidyltransferase